MNFKQLVDEYADSYRITKKTSDEEIRRVTGFIAHVFAVGMADEVIVTGFGRFVRKVTKARQVKLPQGGETTTIPKWRVGLVPYDSLRGDL